MVVEVLTIAIYGIIFYRFYSKRKLRKSMAVRDRARSDLYLAQLRSQSVPNTPGFNQNGLPSAREGGWRPPVDPLSQAENGESRTQDGRFVVVEPKTFAAPKPFTLAPAPIKAKENTPKISQVGFGAPTPSPPPPMPSVSPVQQEQRQEHVPAAPGERSYGQVSIPGAYAAPMASPGFAPDHQNAPAFDFGLDGRR